MVRLEQIQQVDTLIKYWPRLVAVNKKDTPGLSTERLLQIYLQCLEDGVVFVVRNDYGICGVCCAIHDDGTLTLKNIPNDRGTGVAKVCINALKEWGENHNCHIIEVSTDRLNGSAFRYFERCLGFHRKSVTFTLPIPLN